MLLGAAMQEISWVGALIGTTASFLMGALWYSRALFGKAWLRHAGLTEEAVTSASPIRMLGISFPLMFIASLVFAAFLGEASLPTATGAGFAAGLGWVATSLGVNYAFEQKSLGLWLVNAGYHTLQFTVIGLCIGLANHYL